MKQFCAARRRRPSIDSSRGRPDPRRRRDVAQARRAPAGDPSRAPGTDRRRPARPDVLRARLRRRARLVRRGDRAARGRPALARGALRPVRRAAAAQAAGRGPRDAAARAGRLGLAALRAGPRDDPAGHRAARDAHRLGGHEPLDARRPLQRPRLPQEQRAGGLLLGPARVLAAGHQRRLRSPAERRGDQLRRDGARCRQGAGRARRQRRLGPHPARGLGRGRAVRVGAHAPLRPRPANPSRTLALEGPGAGPLVDVLAGHDVIVNCILQDTDAPLMFVMNEDLGRFRPGTLFVDVSCDEGMAFEWARPTSFAHPMATVGKGLHYYAVDHSPSFLWNSATWENSEALLEYLPIVMAGPAAWDADETIRRAIEIREGIVENPRILSFQGRESTYPHAVSGAR